MVSALVTVYKNNVLKFQDGTMGAVNGMRPNGQVSPVLVNTGTGLRIRREQLMFGFFVICKDCSSLVRQAYRARTL